MTRPEVSEGHPDPWPLARGFLQVQADKIVIACLSEALHDTTKYTLTSTVRAPRSPHSETLHIGLFLLPVCILTTEQKKKRKTEVKKGCSAGCHLQV